MRYGIENQKLEKKRKCRVGYVVKNEPVIDHTFKK